MFASYQQTTTDHERAALAIDKLAVYLLINFNNPTFILYEFSDFKIIGVFRGSYRGIRNLGVDR
ncbi:hypothetical protein D3C76_1390650 [compost metagenome]